MLLYMPLLLLKKYEQTSSGEVLCMLVMLARGGWCNWHSSEETQEYQTNNY